MEAVICVVLGALVGSFLNVVILRLPDENASIVFPASHCPKCKKHISWYDNIPVLSFLVLGGRCRHCREEISWQYPLVEILMAALAYGLFTRFYIGVSFAIYFLFCAALLAIIFIDIHHQIIPDRISLPGIVLGLALAFVNPHISWQESVLGALCGGGIFYAIAYGYYLLAGRVGMGGGDIKLLAMIGAFLGWRSLPFVIFSSALLGSVIGIGAMVKQRKGGKTQIPYGPFLAIGSYIYLFFQNEIYDMMVRYYL